MIGIALLGAGRMARVHARAIAAAGAKLVTVFDVIEAAASDLEHQLKFPRLMTGQQGIEEQGIGKR